jgi:UTP--glucose-1-phosphate uridylyltransferase
MPGGTGQNAVGRHRADFQGARIFIAKSRPVGRLPAHSIPAMQIRKAVITAAGPSQRTLPLQTLVDRDGKTKTALAIIVEEALASGTEEICVVVYPGDADVYRAAAGLHGKRLQFVEQNKPQGYGHAVWSAHSFTGADPFLLLVGDHLYLSREKRNCARQLIEAATAEDCAVSAVQATYENKLPYYGVAGGRLADNRKGLYIISEVLEKPTPTVAEQRLAVPGLRAGHYLCFFGMHVLTPAVMDLLGAEVAAGGNVNLSATLSRLATRGRYLAYELHGRRFDIGLTYGLLNAQLALAFSTSARSEILAGIVELLAQETQ